MRDEFSPSTGEVLAKRVGFKCSNPICQTLTCGPRTEVHKFVSIGVAAHISAASPKGPRYNKTLTTEERSSVENGIWLCQNCAKLVDNDTSKYTTELLYSWKESAERFAANQISIRTSEIRHHPQLLEQLSTFARVEFNYLVPYNPEKDGESETYMSDATQIIFSMISGAYLQTSIYLKKDKFVFALSLKFEIKETVALFYGELITHITPFGYFFGLFAEMLNNGRIEEIADYINSSPRININLNAAVGTFVPYKIDRINPTKIAIQCDPHKFIFEKGIVTTSDLLIFLSQSSRKGVTIVDGVNDADSFEKLARLYDKIQDGFDLTEVSIEPEDPEKWYVII